MRQKQKRFRHRLTIKKDNDTFEIFTEISAKQNNKENNCDEIQQKSTDNQLLNDSIRSYLENITNLSANTLNNSDKKLNNANNSDDETSIQETLTIQTKPNDTKPNETKSLETNYEIHQLDSTCELFEEIDNLDKHESKLLLKFPFLAPALNDTKNFQPISAQSITSIVDQNKDIKHFDQTVEVIDNVIFDHVSEEDRSISTEEVMFERWTEETKLIKTKVYKDGELIDEIIERKTPELVGDIQREKLIERHEHIKHTQQDILKRVRVKSPGRPPLQLANKNELLDEQVDGSSILIVEPAKTTRKTKTFLEKTGTNSPIHSLSVFESHAFLNNKQSNSTNKPVSNAPNTLDTNILESFKTDNSTSTISQSITSANSIQKYERPTKSEMKKIYQNNKEKLSLNSPPSSSSPSLSSSSCETKEINQVEAKLSSTDLSSEEDNSSKLVLNAANLMRKNRPLRRESFELAQSNRSAKLNNHSFKHHKDSDSDSSNTNNDLILKRNYELIKQKTTSSHNTLETQNYVSSNTFKPQMLNLKSSTKIKVGSKSRQQTPEHLATNANKNRVKSISPRLLRRGLDIIETIETTTSMSFIMNKTVNLVIEEKYEKPSAQNFAAAPNSSQNLSDAHLNAKPVPITINASSRSKSAPKSNSNSHVTFHRSESSNEIIAVVNVPQAYETTTIESALSQHHNQSRHFSKSVPNLNENRVKKPLKFEIEIEKRQPNFNLKNHMTIRVDGVPVRAQTLNNERQYFIKNLVPGNEVQINTNYLGNLSTKTQQQNSDLSSLSYFNQSNENETTTRISSGYFSGDEFRSPYFICSNNCNNHTSYGYNNNFMFNSGSPTISSSTTDSNFNLKTKTGSFINETLDEVNRMYKECIDFQDEEEENSEQFSSRIKIASDTYYRRIKDDMAVRRKRLSKLNPNYDYSLNFEQNKKRSSSMSSVNSTEKLILPSPTSADYLRNKTRENLTRPRKSCLNDAEMSQILYDDMAYRQLRKDASPYQLKTAHYYKPPQNNNYFFPSNLTNITTLPQSSMSNSYLNDTNSSSISSGSNTKTVRMLKQNKAFRNISMSRYNSENMDRMNYQIMNDSLLNSCDSNGYFDSFNNSNSNNNFTTFKNYEY